ncbi:hypothetical protein IMPR6_690363 [Imperialibacter sp. EC-SDR9]|nr:hypothetical protein IMPERIA89_340364 [Imperialibacter sp. 89]CAD5297972.1 hypothetical protein IMPERIA75_700364 [Imperialibacter sp. 75]VVT34253.1 hypothetical protein IMPR6_690363 [Imperialibacter sp. EC-SDR9]
MENMEQKLFDYLGDKLPAGERKELEKQISKDSVLQKQLISMQNADKLMAEHNMMEFDDMLFTDNIMNRIEAGRARASKSNRLLWMALGIFAAMFAGVLSILPLFQETVPPPTVEPNYLPELPAFDFAPMLETIDNPALIQLVVIATAIAVLLVADKFLGGKFKPNLPSLF